MIELPLSRLTLGLLLLNGFLLACYLVGIRNKAADTVVATAEETIP